MKTLRQACTPRATVFDNNRRDTVHDINDLVEGRIDPKEFFAENFATQGMRTLLTEAFKRLEGGAQAQGVFRLSQSMGGGKTHNLIALGLLAKHPDLREQAMSGFHTPNPSLGEVRVAAFTGRQTDASYGIWGEIARQLGKQDAFAQYYSPLSAPGPQAWINLLAGEPLVILLDELPPYFNYAQTHVIGTGTLADVTTAALANLMNAVADNKLQNVVLVLTDLAGAAYQQGQQKLNAVFQNVEALRDLGNETVRVATPIEPVRINSDEFYQILRTRLFESLPDQSDINTVAQGYADALRKAKLMDITSASPEQFAADIESSYPFHPAIRDLYARFRENEGFQQTRALIRIMRIIVSRLWGGAQSGLPGKADSGYMVGAQDFDLTDSDLASEVKQINSKLENAIAHDIETTNGGAVAQELDDASESTDFTDVCRLLFLSSLANSLDQLHGLNRSEIIGYLAAPNRDVAKLSQDVIDRLQASAWYLHTGRDGRLFFKDVQNINAKLESVTRTMLRDSKEKELREQLDKIFAPTAKDCYQRHLSLPALDEITLTQDAVTLVLVRPSEGSIQTLRQFYDQQTFKNRICFLTGDPSQYDRVLDAASRLRAITSILKELRADGLRDDNPQVQEALDILTKLQGKLYIAVKSTFLTLYYPINVGLNKLDMDFQYTDHAFIAEEQVKNALVAAYKYTKDIGVETAFPRSVENKLWPSGKQETPWSQVKSNAAQLGSWVWHVPNALDSLKSIMIARGQWRESEGYVDKGPFPQPNTEVRIQEIRRDDDTGKVSLRVTPIHGDRVYMETGSAEATTASRLIDEGVVESADMECSFLAVDSAKVHETGDAVKWFNRVTIKHRFFQEGDKMRCELKPAPSAAIKYTTDGSNPASSGGTYDAAFVVPPGARFVQAIPANGKGPLQKFDVPKEPEKVVIDLTKPYEWKRTFKRDSTMDTFTFLGQSRKYDVWLSGVRVYIGHERRWVELSLDNDTYHDVEAIEKVIEVLRTLLENGSISLEATSLNLPTGQALQDLVADLHTTLKPGEIVQVEPRP